MYKKINVRAANRLLCGGQIINISSVSSDGIHDVMTAAWNCPFDADQVLVVLDRGHTTTANILANGKFVISIPSEKDIEIINKVGSAHGRDVGDKFVWARVKPDSSPVLDLQVLPDALAYIECELTEKEVFEKTGVCIGKAVNIYVKDGLWNDEGSHFAEGMKLTLSYVHEGLYRINGREVSI